MHEITARKVEWFEHELSVRYGNVHDRVVREFRKERDRQRLVKMLRMLKDVSDEKFDEFSEAYKGKRKYEYLMKKMHGITMWWDRTNYIDFGKPENMRILKTVMVRNY